MTKKMTMFGTKMKKRKSRLRRMARLPGLALGAALAVGMGAGAWPAQASAAAVGKVKPTKAPTLRTVDGTVCNKEGAPIQGAVVYLQDTKTMAVKSFLSDEDGHFHFRQLPMSTDFGLWAELNGKRTKTKNISQFNSHAELSYKLKLDVAK